MDIYCPRCAEPWDNDMFHEVAEERTQEEGTKVTYRQVVADFQARGCIALGGGHCERTGGLRAEASAMLMELGDMDGAMSDLADFEQLGFFNE
jgi:hypothetical protein